MKEPYRFHQSREVLGKIKTVTVKRSKAGDLYVYFVTDWDDDQDSPRRVTARGLTLG
jgi:hypothetical protein